METNNIIDTSFDFTEDTDGKYWDGFWYKKDGLGEGGVDPDSYSPKLRLYHKILWSKNLNGTKLVLKEGKSNYDYLYSDENGINMRFASDSLVTGFRYYDCIELHNELKRKNANYQKELEQYIRLTYTIGGMIIFPKFDNTKSINQMRGFNSKIRDRVDLTIECIRKFYKNEDSPLSFSINKNRAFFDLFESFENYINFFLLQDLVSDDYKTTNIWIGQGDFSKPILPQSIDDYRIWVEKSTDFINKRNNRIANYMKNLIIK